MAKETLVLALLLRLRPLEALVAPTKLIVLSHGLYGGATNLQVLEELLVRQGGGDLLVHQAACNEGFTRDGVSAGGRRLAAEVRTLASSHESLESLVLVGNSLGGLYVRYAAADLLGDDGRMAGLRPSTLCTIGCPHLGVRRHTFLPLPSQVQAAGVIVAGRTADDLLLRDAATPSASLLAEMASRDSRYGALHSRLVGAFACSGPSSIAAARHRASQAGPSPPLSGAASMPTFRATLWCRLARRRSSPAGVRQPIPLRDQLSH